MRVWVDHHLCIGNGICADICPEVFQVAGGIAYVLGPDGARLASGVDGSADVSGELVDAVIEAAEECPAECIYLDVG